MTSLSLTPSPCGYKIMRDLMISMLASSELGMPCILLKSFLCLKSFHNSFMRTLLRRHIWPGLFSSLIDLNFNNPKFTPSGLSATHRCCVSCSIQRVVVHRRDPWIVDWEPPLDFCNSQRVVFIPIAYVSWVRGYFVRSQSVLWRLLVIGMMMKLALFRDLTHVPTLSVHTLFVQQLNLARGRLDVKLEVGFFRTFSWYSYRRAADFMMCVLPCADSHALHPSVGVGLTCTSTASPSGFEARWCCSELDHVHDPFSRFPHTDAQLSRARHVQSH